MVSTVLRNNASCLIIYNHQNEELIIVSKGQNTQSTMKLFSSLAFLAIASLAPPSMATNTCPTGFTPIVRLTIDPEVSVSTADAAILAEAVVNAATRRNLRDGRQLTSCSILCANWAPGYCYIAHPQCVGWRQMAEDGHDVEAGSEGIPNRVLTAPYGSCSEVEAGVTQNVNSAPLSQEVSAAVADPQLACFCVEF
jgi:hypothetical protein